MKQDRFLWPKFVNSFNSLDIYEVNDHLELNKNTAVKSTAIYEK